MTLHLNPHIRAHIAFTAVDEMVRDVLINPQKHEWQVQGLGMIRTKLSPSLRLHIWHKGLVTKPVTSSVIHTHPWSFESLIMGGELRNRRFLCSMNGWGQHDYLRQPIICGPNGDAGMPEPEEASLVGCEVEVYHRGDAYGQRADELHYTDADDGAVSLIERHFVNGEDKSAYTFFTPGDTYVNRGAMNVSCEEAAPFCTLALEKMA